MGCVCFLLVWGHNLLAVRWVSNYALEYQDPVQIVPYVGACRGYIQDEHRKAVVTLPHPFSLKPYQEHRTLFVQYSWEILALLPALPPSHDLGLLGYVACMLTLRPSPLSTFNHL